MLRMTHIVLIALLIIPCISHAETIDVNIKGVDDGVKTTKQQDYKEAALFAKREAIERAGVKVKALTTARDFVVHSDYIESEAEAVLLPGYNIVDVGYQTDGTYLVVLIGKVKTSASGSSPKAVDWDGSFVKYATGVVYDKNTGLEWYAGPDRNTDWNAAKTWVENLEVSGGGWRMPTIKELKTLYKKETWRSSNKTFLLETTGWWVWSGETKDSSSALTLNFTNGGNNWFFRNSSSNNRGFAVRSRK
jgi:hypothetical protein